MASDAEWVEDVKRWYFAGQGAVARTPAPSTGEDASGEALGYEAAHPALQARHWPDAPVGSAASTTPIR